MIPFYSHLVNIHNAMNKNVNLLNHLTNTLIGESKRVEGIDREELSSFIDEKLAEGDFLFLLDGFDQTEGNDNKMLLGVGPGADVFKNSKLIIATRPYAIKESDILQAYKKLEIKPFGPRQVAEYFKKLEGVDNQMVSRLLQDFFEIAQIPVLMSLLGKIASDKQDKLKKISKRSDVYSVFCEKIIKENRRKIQNRAPDAGSTDSSLMLDQMEHIAFLAFDQGKKAQMDQKFIRESIIDHVSRISSIQDLHTLCQFGIVHQILDQTIAPEPPFLEFKHQSFQEYFAAQYAVTLLKKAKKTSIEAFLYKRGTNIWKEVLCFIAESEDIEDVVRESMVDLLWNQYNTMPDKDRNLVYDAARILGCLSCRGSSAHAGRIKQELTGFVALGVDDVVKDEKPFRALRDIGEIEYLFSYASNQNQFNSVNRFYAFKYAFSTVGVGHTVDNTRMEQILEKMLAGINPTSTTKLDFLFALGRVNAKFSEELMAKFWLMVHDHLRDNSDMKLPSSVVNRIDGHTIEKYIKPLIEQTKSTPFFWHGKLVDLREILIGDKGIWKTKFLQDVEQRLKSHIDRNRDSSWEHYEDVCAMLLGMFGDQEIAQDFYRDFLQEDCTNPNEYKQAVMAVAVALAFSERKKEPEKKNDTQRKMLNDIAKRCVDIFEKGPNNPYRYYLAGALAFIGGPSVIEYFLDFIQRRQEKQRWFAVMVLGSLDDQNMLERLEVLSKQSDKDTKYFANQALLIHTQSHVYADLI